MAALHAQMHMAGCSHRVAVDSTERVAVHRLMAGNTLRKRAARQPVATMAFGGASAVFETGPQLSQLASAVGFALGALWLGREVLATERVERDNEPECPTCEGTGFVECMCGRWSDGDVGCGTCRGSGKMVCHSCGGSGTGRPIVAKIIAKSGDGRY